jgi:hypothetical protein
VRSFPRVVGEQVSPGGRGWTLSIACSLFLLAGCARAPRPGEPLERLQQRYQVARDHREAMLGALTGEWLVRAEGRGTGRLPALPAVLQLAAPERARLRVSALVGVALDVLVAHDSLFAWLPAKRTAFAASGDSLGLGAPAAFAGRVLAATWLPPRAAWGTAVADSGHVRLAWREQADSLELVLDGGGTPLEAWMGREGRGVRVRYTDWTNLRGETFPRRLELADDTGYVRVRLEADDVEAPAHADESWFTPRRSQGWRTMTWDDLKDALHRRLSQ